jgi:integrase/recombinase XerD
MEKVSKIGVTSSVLLWDYTANNERKHPVKLCVTFNRKRKYYPVTHDGKKLFLSGPDWKTIQDREKSVRGINKAIRETIDKVSAQANKAISTVMRGDRPFTWPGFEREFLVKDSGESFLSFFNKHVESLRTEGRIGTYRSYGNAYSAFKAFRKEKELSPFDLTPDMLRSFDAHLLKKKRPGKESTKTLSRTTICIYMRVIKTIYNLMADDNPELLKVYPFARKQNDRKKYKIKLGSGHQGESLTVEQLQKFIGLKVDPTSQPEQHEAKLFFLFSFHCQGMNMRDIFLLKYSDIQGQMIRYVRHKTRMTETKESVMEIQITDAIRQIIIEIGNPDKRPNNYVFTVIPNGLAINYQRRTDRDVTPEERITQIIQQKTKMINKRLKNLCEQKDVKLPVITTYWARHSYANLLRESGEGVEVIRELLGHSDVRTTENYLKRFDAEYKRKVNEKISSLLKVS